MAEPDRVSDWDIIWRSEWRAMADDRELREAAASALDAAARAWSAPPPWAPPAAVPPDDGGPAGAVGRLVLRVEELERRLAALDAARPA